MNLKVIDDLGLGGWIGELMPYMVYVHLDPVHTVAKVSPVIGGHELMSHGFGILVPRASFRHAVGYKPYNLLLGYNQLITI